MPRAVEATHHGTERKVEEGRDLLVGQPFQIAQREDDAVGCAQAPNARCQARKLFRPWLPRQLLVSGMGAAFLVEAQLCRTTPQPHAAYVQRDAAQPARKTCRVSQLIELEKRVDKAVVCELGRHRGSARDAVTQGVDAGAVALDELAE